MLYLFLCGKSMRRAEPTMNYRSLWGVATEQVIYKKNLFSFFKIILHQKLELIDFADLSHSPN